MFKRPITILTLIVVFLLGTQPLRIVQGLSTTPAAEVQMLNSTSTPDGVETGTKNQNGFVRVLKAPFKAIGRLFGAGKKDGKLQRLSQKDVKGFETAGLTRVVDARSPARSTEPPALPAESAAEDSNLVLALQNLERGRTFLNSERIYDAIAMLSTATSLNPKLSEAHNLLGVAYEMKGMRDKAFKSFGLALRVKPNAPEYLNNLGYLHFKNGDYDQAAKYLKRAVKNAPNVQRYWNNLGLVQAQRAKFDDAYECFRHAVGEYEAHMNVANRSQAMGFDKEAIKHLEQARVLSPTTAEILLRLAVLYKRVGKPELAEEANTALVSVRAVAAAQQ
jgi:Flp pilus assembly protein TadD